MAKIMGIGEVLWDVFPDQRLAGGAPFNFAWHARRLGHEAAVISRVGVDALGDEILAYARAGGLDVSNIQRDAEHATGTVQVTLRDAQPSYEIVEQVAWDFIEASETALAAVSGAEAICFGSLAQRGPVSAAAMRTLLAAATKAIVIFDVNLRQDFYNREGLAASFRLAQVAKLNDEELREMGAMLFDGESDPARIAASLRRAFGLRLVVETRGAKGCVLYAEDRTVRVPGIPVETVDCVGAGDAFTAALADGLVRGRSLEESARRANALGAFVTGRAGGTPRCDLEEFEGVVSRDASDP